MESEWLETVRQVWEEYKLDYYTRITAMRETTQVRNGLRNLVADLIEVAVEAETARTANHSKSAEVYQGQPYDAGLFDVVRFQDMSQIYFINRQHALQETTQALRDKMTSTPGLEMLLNLQSTLCEQLKKLEHNWKWWKKLQLESRNNIYNSSS